MAEEEEVKADTGGVSRMMTQQVAAMGGVDDGTMEDIIDKLKILDYELHFCQGKSFKPLTRTFFSRPAANPNEQFFYFTSLVSWLMEICDHSYKAPGQFDDPNTSANNILAELKRMDFTLKDIASKLRVGHGEAVLHVLNILCDKGMTVKDWSFKPPEYPLDNYEDELETDDAAATDDIADEVMSESDGEEEWYDATKDRDDGANNGNVSNGAIETSVNPDDWRMELERVSPYLKLNRRSDHKDWRSHLDWILSLLKTIERMFPEVKGQLTKIGDDLAKALEKIQKREHSLGLQFDSWVDDYRIRQKDCQAITENHKASSDSVATLGSELAHIAETLDGVKADISAREERMTDTSPLVRIKDAVAKIKMEIKQMELRIGVLQHTVLHHRIKQAGRAAVHKRLNDSGDASPGAFPLF